MSSETGRAQHKHAKDYAHKINIHHRLMSENEVKAWLVENKFKQTFIDLLMPSDGLILREFYEMRRDAPEFYYQSLRMEYSLGMKEICLFTSKLKHLFD